MRVGRWLWVTALLIALLPLSAGPKPAAADTRNDAEDLTPRLQEIYQRRAQWLLTDATPPPIEEDYLPDSKTAQWALHHERGKIHYMKQWAKNRGVRFVQSEPVIKVRKIKGTPDKARYYVAQTLALGYVYENDERVNQFGVGTRHIIELQRRGGKWLISLEWYTDPLGDDTEIPDVTPALVTPGPLLPHFAPRFLTSNTASDKGYDREGAVRYADQYCGLAWGCGNEHRYNPRYKDYNGVGGDCTNFVSQVLREGGGLNVPIITRVDALAGHLRHTGLASVVKQGEFHTLWKEAKGNQDGFTPWITIGDLIAYQEKGKLEHFAVVTGFDSAGYPLVNSHSADRFRVPFDLGWDRKTVYWLFHIQR